MQAWKEKGVEVDLLPLSALKRSGVFQQLWRQMLAAQVSGLGDSTKP